MNEEFWDDLKQSIEGRCAWNAAGNCCRGIEEAYKAGVDAMRERCAEVAEADDTCECGCSSDYECNHCAIKKNIAVAIRGQEI